MTIPLRVLGDRVLVKPDVNSNAPTQTEAGIYVAATLQAAVSGDDPTTSFHRGTVIAVGTPKHPRYDEAVSAAEHLDFDSKHGVDGRRYDDGHCAEIGHLLLDLVCRQPCVAVGDDVLFSHDAGQETTLGGETYVILREQELIAVIDPEPGII